MINKQLFRASAPPGRGLHGPTILEKDPWKVYPNCTCIKKTLFFKDMKMIRANPKCGDLNRPKQSEKTNAGSSMIVHELNSGFSFNLFLTFANNVSFSVAPHDQS